VGIAVLLSTFSSLPHVHPLFGCWRNVGECLQKSRLRRRRRSPQLTPTTSFGTSIHDDAPQFLLLRWTLLHQMCVLAGGKQELIRYKQVARQISSACPLQASNVSRILVMRWKSGADPSGFGADVQGCARLSLNLSRCRKLDPGRSCRS
jgi:hypothetical protein